MFQHGVSVIAGLGQRGIGVGTEQHRVGTVDADEPQLAQALGDGIRILAHIAGQRHLRIAGSLPDAHDSGSGIALEYGAVLGKSELARGVLRRLPVRVVRATLDVVDRLALQFERNTQLDQRLHFALPGDDAVPRGRDRPQMAGADGGEAVPAGPCTSTTRRPARWRLSVRDVSSSICAQAASEMGASSRCRLFMWDFSFKGTDTQRTIVLQRGGWRVFDRRLGRRRCDGRGWSSVTFSRNVAVGTKNKFPVTARLKSSSRS